MRRLQKIRNDATCKIHLVERAKQKGYSKISLDLPTVFYPKRWRSCDHPTAAQRRAVTMNGQLVLSLFPGIDLLGRGFEAEGFTIVRGPDILWGGDVREFTPPPNRFDGIIGGSPCQDFSAARRSAPTGNGLEMLGEFVRVVLVARPRWFLLENVPAVPDVKVDGYFIQRFDLNARECGMRQSRLRHFQFGSLDGLVLVPERKKPTGERLPIAMASEGNKINRRSFADFCELQGLPRSFNLQGMTKAARYKAVGNGVPIPMARTIARAIVAAHIRSADVRLCVCGCGRICAGRETSALPACRKRMERRRKRDYSTARTPGVVTA